MLFKIKGQQMQKLTRTTPLRADCKMTVNSTSQELVPQVRLLHVLTTVFWRALGSSLEPRGFLINKPQIGRPQHKVQVTEYQRNVQRRKAASRNVVDAIRPVSIAYRLRAYLFKNVVWISEVLDVGDTLRPSRRSGEPENSKNDGDAKIHYRHRGVRTIQLIEKDVEDHRREAVKKREDAGGHKIL